MAELIFGHDDALAQWAEKTFPELAGFQRPFTTIGIAHGDRLMGVAIYNQYHGHDIRFSLGAASPKWATRGTIRALLHYPFFQLGVARMTAVTAKGNKRARRILEGVGFRLEGTHPKAEDGKQAAMSYGILKDSPELMKWFR